MNDAQHSRTFEAGLSPLGQAALEWVRNGFAVFPCRPRGKDPLTTHGFKDATRDEAQIHRWWMRWPNANIGLPTGEENELVVIDVDGIEGEKRLAMLGEKFGKLPPTSRGKTGNGRHIFFAVPDGCDPIPSSVAEGLDIRGDGGYVVGPPSVHPNGKAYEWDEQSPEDFALAPPWLLDVARNWKAEIETLGRPGAADRVCEGKDGGSIKGGAPTARQRRANGNRGASTAAFANVRAPEPWTEAGEARLRSALAAIPAEKRDGVWREVGFALHDLAAGDQRWPGRPLWDEWSKTCAGKFDPAGQDKAWASFRRGYDGERVGLGTVYRLAKENGWIDPHNPLAAASDEAPIIEPKATVEFSRRLRTDVGNARAFLDLFGENLRFVEKWGCWIVWDDARWVEASDVAMLPIGARATEEMLKWAVAQPVGNADRNAWINHAVATQRDARLRAMINLAKGDARARIEPDALDADAWLLGCPNGTLDLRTGELREAGRQDYITKQISMPFDSAADCSQWRQFLDWAMEGDSEKTGFLQALAGYALTGEVREEKMCVFVGDGANGKSTFLMTLHDLFGDYAGKVRSDLLVHAQGKEGAPSPDIAALHGKRFVIASETEDGCSLSEARIKDIVSNEVVAARRLHRDPFTFRPTHKIILETNHPPHVRGTDHGIWRRLAIVRFNATIEEDRKVADFRERVLRPESAGILNWAVEGLTRWKRDGLRLPASVREATAEHRAAMDTVGQWIEERTERDPSSIVPVSSLHNDYVSYLGPHVRPFGPRRFSEELERKGYAADKLTGGVRARRGLKLKPLGPPIGGAATRLAVVR
jgi:putative DNA primase/helicase